MEIQTVAQYTRVYRWELFLFTMTLFIMLITHRYINGLWSSVYSSGNKNSFPSPWHYSLYSLHTSIPADIARWYIPKVMGIVPLHPNIIHSVHYTQVYRRAVSIGIFQRWWELFPFIMTLFMVFITHEYTDELWFLVYSWGYQNCSPSP